MVLVMMMMLALAFHVWGFRDNTRVASETQRKATNAHTLEPRHAMWPDLDLNWAGLSSLGYNHCADLN
uniref:Putative secreted protein n=1 Tax=Anopheles triannulatus TaxID=58253 RepID=A0A2M4B7Q8_9DIPT